MAKVAIFVYETYKPLISAHSKVNSRTAPSLEAHHRSHGPDKGNNSGGSRKKMYIIRFIRLTVIMIMYH